VMRQGRREVALLVNGMALTQDAHANSSGKAVIVVSCHLSLRPKRDMNHAHVLKTAADRKNLPTIQGRGMKGERQIVESSDFRV